MSVTSRRRQYETYVYKLNIQIRMYIPKYREILDLKLMINRYIIMYDVDYIYIYVCMYVSMYVYIQRQEYIFTFFVLSD